MKRKRGGREENRSRSKRRVPAVEPGQIVEGDRACRLQPATGLEKGDASVEAASRFAVADELPPHGTEHDGVNSAMGGYHGHG